MSSAVSSAKFGRTDPKLHVRIVTFSTKYSAKLIKQLSEGFKRSVYCNSYQTKPPKVIEKGKKYTNYLMRHFKELEDYLFLLMLLLQVLQNNEAGIKDSKKYFLPRGEIKNYNVLIDGRKLYDQPINDLIKQYDEVRKVSAGQGDDYTTGCLLNYAYFKDSYRLIAIDLSKKNLRC